MIQLKGDQNTRPFCTYCRPKLKRSVVRSTGLDSKTYACFDHVATIQKQESEQQKLKALGQSEGEFQSEWKDPFK